MNKKFKWTLFSLLTAVTLCGCVGTTNEDPTDEPNTEVNEEITPTKEGIISWINENFSDVNDMTSFKFDCNFVQYNYADSTHTTLVSTESNMFDDFYIYGTTDFVYLHMYFNTREEDCNYLYMQRDGKVCSERMFFDYLNTQTEEPTSTQLSHYCQYDQATPTVIYKDESVHEYCDINYSFSPYVLTEGAQYDLSQYDWEETDEENTWLIEDYDLFWMLFRKTEITFDGLVVDYRTEVSINEDGNLVLAPGYSWSTLEREFIYELTEVGTISTTFEEVDGYFDTLRYEKGYSIYHYSSAIGGDSVVRNIYTRESEDDEWVAFSTGSTSNVTYKVTPGLQVGIELEKSASTLLNFYINDDTDRETISLDDENGVYYFTMPKDNVYVQASWTE